MASCIKNWS